MNAIQLHNSVCFVAHIQLHMLRYFLSVFNHSFLSLYAYMDTADTEYLCVCKKKMSFCFWIAELVYDWAS